VSLEALPEGRHPILITDRTGCRDTISVDILRPSPLVLDVVDVTHPIDSDSGDGAIDINVTGGTPPYSYLWRTEDEDFSNEEDLSLLFPGVYVVEVMDDNGCISLSDSIQVESITSALSAAISVMPNPTSDYLLIDVSDQYDVEFLSIFDLAGRVVRSPFIFKNQVDVSDLASGQYLLIIDAAQGQKGLYRFIKQ